MWGVRNGPPYPLDTKTHNRVKKQKSATVGRLENLNPVSDITESFGFRSSYLNKISNNLFADDYNKILNTSLPNASDPGGYNLPMHSIKKGEYQFKDSLDKSKYRLDVDAIRQRTPMKMPQYLDDNVGEFLTNQMKKVNPWHKDVRGATNNCAKCSATLTLMKMGYNQVQAGLSDYGSKAGCQANWFKDGITQRTNDLQDISEALKNAPNGSFGTLSCGRTDKVGNRTSGHSMAWTKTRNGKIRIEDGQDTKIYNSFDEVIKVQNFSSGTIATFSDLTNAKPNWQMLAADGVCQLPNNKVVANTDQDYVDAWIFNTSTPSISRSNYSVFNVPQSTLDMPISSIKIQKI